MRKLKLLCFSAVISISISMNNVSIASIVELEHRLTWIESQLLNLTGRIDELAHELKKLDTTVDNMSSNKILDNRSELSLQAKTQSHEHVAHSGFLPFGGAKERYAQGRSLLNTGNYTEAEKVFKAFVRDYPDHLLVINAHYWLGETHYIQGDFERASLEFANTYQTYQKNKQKTSNNVQKLPSKAPESLVKLAMCLRGMKKNEEATATLTQLDEEFPNATLTVKKLAQRVRKGLDGTRARG
jgi:tol-pal system protein YbgF